MTGSSYGDTFKSKGTGYALGDKSPTGPYSTNGLYLTVDGLAGNDTYVGTNTTDDVRQIINGDGDNDTITLNIGGVVYGGAGDDTITGSSEGDNIDGDDDDDTITANAGRDCVFGSGGDDTIYGNDDPDELVGGTNDDEIRGHAGADQIWGETGIDDVYGGNGDDVVRGNQGQDDIFGGGNDDILCTGTGTDDVTSGGNGDDTHWALTAAVNPTGTDNTSETNVCGHNGTWTNWVTNCSDTLSTAPSECNTSAPVTIALCSSGVGVPW
jgi:Ca2+-binding RTX toxin-like protein